MLITQLQAKFMNSDRSSSKALVARVNTGPDPLKNHKATKPAFNVGQSSFRWRADDGPFIVAFGSSIPSSTKKKEKKRYQIWTPLTKLSGSAHVLCKAWSSILISLYSLKTKSSQCHFRRYRLDSEILSENNFAGFKDKTSGTCAFIMVFKK